MEYKKIYFLALFFLLLNCVHADKGYEIKVQVAGIGDTTAILANHYGNRQYIQDSVQIDAEGQFIFKGDTALQKGMYMVVLPGQRYFELLVDENQHFGVQTKINDFVSAMQFENSPQNRVFYDYMQFVKSESQKRQPLIEKINAEDTPEEDVEKLERQINEINRRVEKYQDQIIEENPDYLFSKILLAQKDPGMPEPVYKEDGTQDNAMMYHLFKQKFWKNIDFSDDRLVRTPIFHNKLDQFFSRVVMQMPDSIIAEADRIMKKAEANREVYKYTLFYITTHFERSQIMGMDAVFVHMVENYYMKGKADWVSEEQLQKISERAMILKPLLLGKKAPDISVFKPDRSQTNLHSIDAKYTILYFWDPECGHCKKQTPKLKELYNSIRNEGIELEVFAVNTQGDDLREEWLNYIDENSIQWINAYDPYNRSGFRDKYDIFATPLMYLLDEDKKIIAKRIDAEQAEDILKRELGL